MSMGMLRLPAILAESVASLELNRWLIMVIICLLYMVLGWVLEALSMLLLTIPE